MLPGRAWDWESGLQSSDGLDQSSGRFYQVAPAPEADRELKV